MPFHSYAAVAIIVGVGIVAFRDAWGIRPLIYGRSSDNSFIAASESVALDTLGFDPIRDVNPGEGIFLDLNGNLHTRVCHPSPVLTPCMFELVYLARPDSVLDGISVYQARLKMGAALARRIKNLHPQHGIDVVVPVPDTGRVFALELAHELGVPYREALTKNRYIPRTFIMPGQSVRRKGVRLKLNTIRCEIEGKVRVFYHQEEDIPAIVYYCIFFRRNRVRCALLVHTCNIYLTTGGLARG
jgi:amidophosphoribosyltransferase